MTGDVTPATLNLTGLTAANKVYDAGLTTTLTGTPSITPIGGDSVSLAGSPFGVFLDKNVGTAKPVSVVNVGLTGADNANYVLATPTLTANITPFQLSLSGVTVNNKVYDATLNATLSGTSTANFFAGDSAALSGGTIAFTDKNVGTGKSVQLSGFGLTGPDAPNYLAPTATVLTANITPATLNLSGLTAANKVYDGGTTAALTGTPSVTPLAQRLGQRVRHADRHLRRQERRHGQARHRVQRRPLGHRQRQLRARHAADPDRQHHAGAIADRRLHRCQQGVRRHHRRDPDRQRQLRAARQRQRDRQRLTGRHLQQQERRHPQRHPGRTHARWQRRRQLHADAVERPRCRHHPGHVTVSGIDREQQGLRRDDDATLGGSAVAAAFGSDVVNVGGTPLASFSNKNVGTAKSVAVSGYTLSGADAGNYTVAQPTGLSANITPATLQISGVSAANKTYDGSVAATISGSAAVAALAAMS